MDVRDGGILTLSSFFVFLVLLPSSESVSGQYVPAGVLQPGSADPHATCGPPRIQECATARGTDCLGPVHSNAGS